MRLFTGKKKWFLIVAGMVVLFISFGWFAGDWYSGTPVRVEPVSSGDIEFGAADGRKERATLSSETVSAAPATVANSVWEQSPADGEDLPPEDTPWPQLYGALEDRASRGDAAAASRLYKDLLRCQSYWAARDAAQYFLASTSSVADSQLDLENGSNMAQSLSATLADGKAMCGETSPEKLAEKRYTVLLQAANTGSESAAECFTISAPSTPQMGQEGGLRNEYKADATRFMHQGIVNGSWKMVSQMATYYDWSSRPTESRWLTELWPDDPRKAYLYTAVQMIGAQSAGYDDEVNALQGAMRELSRRIHWSSGEHQATLQQATGIYRDYFSASPYVRRNDLVWCAP